MARNSFTMRQCGRLWIVALVLIVGGWALAPRAGAQVPIYDIIYRPPGTDYLVLRSPHFDVIFQEGLEVEAREVADVLERTLPGTKNLVGMRSSLRMPVVLNRFNDRSNGYVTPLPFKQEIEGIRLKGKALSPRHPSWIDVVASHELVHAVHADLDPGFGVGRIVRWFAPDVSRSINLAAPAGLVEGVAVYRESRLEGSPEAGRLNFSLFEMQFRAAMLSNDPWSLAQTLERSAYTWPFNRHYIGGAHLFQYLAGQDEGRFFRRATRFHYRFPFLGFGVSLWHGTRRRPVRLNRQFRSAVQEAERARLAQLGAVTSARILAGGKRGIEHRRPIWLDAQTLVVYASGYDLRPGFYRIDAATGARTLIRAQAITEDDYFSLTPDGRAIVAARYVPDPFSSIQAISEVERIDLTSGDVTRLTDNGRVLGPIYSPSETLWALQNDGQFNHWVAITPDGGVERLSQQDGLLFTSLHPSPDGDAVAVVLNVEGTQGLFKAAINSTEGVRLTPWVVFKEASVYDAAWSADGRYLLFSADPGGIANIFAVERETNRVLQVTNVAFGALEPRLAPDGQRLAFVEYQHERYDLMLLPFTPEAYEVVDPARLQTDVEMPAPAATPAATPTATPAATNGDPYPLRPYQSWRYAAPRVFYPTLHADDGARDPSLDAPLKERFETRLGLGVGLGVQGTDPLQSWRYMGEVFVQNGRPWGRGTVELGTVLPRPYLTVYDEPSVADVGVTVITPDANGSGADTSTVSIQIGVEERGATLGLRLPITLQSNVFQSRLTIGLEGDYEQVRLFNDANETIRDDLGRFTLQPYLIWLHRIQANPRDIVPNSGLVGTLTSELDVWNERGRLRQALIGRLDLYLPFLRAHNIGVRIGAGLLTQNQRSIFNLHAFQPRGYEGRVLPSGTFVRYDVEYTQPLWYIDDGFVLVPAYFNALYAYLFAETLHPLEDASASARLSTVGAGLGLQMRFASLFNLSLRVAASYLVDDGTWKISTR